MIKRIAVGLHPLWRAAKGGGSASSRDRVNVTAAYDAVVGIWKETRRSQDPTDSTDDGKAELAADEDSAETLPQQAATAHLPEANDEAMHEPRDDYPSEEDVFGHGGELDEEARRPLDQEMACTAPLTGAVAMDTCAPPHLTTATSTCSRRRRREDPVKHPRDYEREAIDRLGGALTRRDTGAPERMAQLRRRIAERTRKEPANPTDDGTTATPGGTDQGRITSGAADGDQATRIPADDPPRGLHAGQRRERDEAPIRHHKGGRGDDEGSPAGHDARKRRCYAQPPTSAAGGSAVGGDQASPLTREALLRELRGQGRGVLDLPQRIQLGDEARGVKRPRQGPPAGQPEPSQRPRHQCGGTEGASGRDPTREDNLVDISRSGLSP